MLPPGVSAPTTGGSRADPQAAYDPQAPYSPQGERRGEVGQRPGQSKEGDDKSKNRPIRIDPQKIAAADQAKELGGSASLTISAGQGGVALREPVKKVRHGDDEIELRTLTREEKAARRFRRNIIMAVIGIGFLITATLVLVQLTSG